MTNEDRILDLEYLNNCIENTMSKHFNEPDYTYENVIKTAFTPVNGRFFASISGSDNRAKLRENIKKVILEIQKGLIDYCRYSISMTDKKVFNPDDEFDIKLTSYIKSTINEHTGEISELDIALKNLTVAMLNGPEYSPDGVSYTNKLDVIPKAITGLRLNDLEKTDELSVTYYGDNATYAAVLEQISNELDMQLSMEEQNMNMYI